MRIFLQATDVGALALQFQQEEDDVMVFAPHDDDETAELRRRAKAAGNERDYDALRRCQWTKERDRWLAAVRKFEPDVLLSSPNLEVYAKEARSLGIDVVIVHRGPPKPRTFLEHLLFQEEDLPRVVAAPAVLADVILPKKSNVSVVAPLDDAKMHNPNTAALEAVNFLRGDEATIYCGWDDTLCRSTKYLSILYARAVAATGLRAIVLRGAANLTFENLVASVDGAPDGDTLIAYAARNIFYLDAVRCPRPDMLFPRCTAIVHDGRAATVHTALLAGRPQIITPIWRDDVLYARAVHALDVGHGFTTQLHYIDPVDLARAIVACVNDDALHHRAATLATSCSRAPTSSLRNFVYSRWLAGK